MVGREARRAHDIRFRFTLQLRWFRAIMVRAEYVHGQNVSVFDECWEEPLFEDEDDEDEKSLFRPDKSSGPPRNVPNG
jgi:hypothetical protein